MKNSKLLCNNSLTCFKSSKKLLNFIKVPKVFFTFNENILVAFKTRNYSQNYIQGDIAQMVERSLSMREVSGSIPDISIFAICVFLTKNRSHPSRLNPKINIRQLECINLTFSLKSKFNINVINSM
jgi:hypothetical protein